MQTNDKKITGILHQTLSAKYYQLKRYLPAPELALLIEQFWIVSWDLRNRPSHTQQNLPDPNMHLVIGPEGIKVMGPVSKQYRYQMAGQGKIVGVKFNVGVLAQLLPMAMHTAVDKEFTLKEVFNIDLSSQALSQLSDQSIVEFLSQQLLNFVDEPTPSLQQVQDLVKMIQNEQDMTQVSVLAEKAGTSIRNIQRLFKQYIGLSPKWLIRKYRLHQVLEMLENRQLQLADVANDLEYSDQSHLIRDFKDFLGITPSQYR